MPVTIKVKAEEEAICTERCASVQRVLDACEFNHLPELKLLAFFDDTDDQDFMNEYGTDNRGLFFPAKSCTSQFPPRFAKLLFVQSPDRSLVCSAGRNYFYDGFIYLYGSTCVDPTALAMTFAHELQHFVQFGRDRSLWAANTILSRISGINITKLPYEREARIVSKRVAEKLCGVDIVHQYILRKIGDAGACEEVKDWQLIERLDSSTPYDLENETKLMFQCQIQRGLRSDLERIFNEMSNEPSFHGIDLAPYFDG
jgi:hypothetical protein